jgi:transposase
MQVRCEVVAPSLIPWRPAIRSRPTVGTAGGWRGCTRAGELVAIRVPTVQEEAVLDLCRARADIVQDRTRAPSAKRVFHPLV